MEPVLFYGIPHGCSFGSIVAFEWSGLPYRLSRIDMLDKDPAYSRINPLNYTPALMREDGTVLTESLAILQHIAGRAPESKLGFAAGTREFDALNSALAWLHTSFHGAFAPLWNAFKLPEGAPEIPMLQKMGRENVAGAFAHLEGWLKDRDWLVGDHRTLADAYFLAVARWAEDLKLFTIAADYPAVGKLVARLEADPAVRFAHAIEDSRHAETVGRFLGHVTLDEFTGRLAA